MASAAIGKWLLALLAAALVLPMTASASPRRAGGSCAIAGVLWCGNFSTGNASQYTDVLGRPLSEITFPTRPAFNSTHSARFRLTPRDIWTDGTNRMSLREADDACGGQGCWTEGADVYYHVAMYIGRTTTIGGNFSNPWRALFSWPTSEKGDCSNGGFGLVSISTRSGDVVRAGTPALEMSGHNCNSSGNENNYWWLLDPVKGAWYQFIVHRHYSSAPSRGFEEIWLKKPGSSAYTLQTLNGPAGRGARRAHFATLGCQGCHANMRLGIYRNGKFTTTDVIYYDDIRAASSFNAAALQVQSAHSRSARFRAARAAAGRR